MARSAVAVYVAAALVSSLQRVSLVHGFSTGIGGCPSGPGAIFGAGSSHSGEPVDISTLDTTFTLNGVIVNSADAGTVPVGVDIPWSLDSTNINGMKGILVRVEAANEAYTIASSILANEAIFCTDPGVKGLSHSEPSSKTSVPGTIRFDEAGSATVDLTVVFANGFDPATGASVSITGYTQFTFVVGDAVAVTPAPATVPGVTQAPVAVSTESPIAASTEPPVEGATEPPTVTPVDATVAPTIASVDTEAPTASQVTDGPIVTDEPVETEPPIQTEEPVGTSPPKGKGGKGSNGDKGTKAPKGDVGGKGSKGDEVGKGKGDDGGKGKGDDGGKGKGDTGKGKGDESGKGVKQGKGGTKGEGKGKKEGKEKGAKGKGEGKGKEAKVPKVGKSEKADKVEKEKGEKKQMKGIRYGRD